MRSALLKGEEAVQIAGRAGAKAHALAQQLASERATLAAELDGARDAMKSLQRIAKSDRGRGLDGAAGTPGEAESATNEAKDLRERLAAACRAET